MVFICIISRQLVHEIVLQMNISGKLNFIKQDVKKGNLRYVGNVFPHHGYIWNYGAFPQVWIPALQPTASANCSSFATF